MEELRGHGVGTGRRASTFSPSPPPSPHRPCSAARKLQALHLGGFYGGAITYAWPTISSVPSSCPGSGERGMALNMPHFQSLSPPWEVQGI